MANHAQGREDPLAAEEEPPLQGDARVLYRAMRECIRTSPTAFSMTLEEFRKKSADHWDHEVRTATWAVIERSAEVIGIAVARHPDSEQDADVDQGRARFIESAWITPKHRRSRMGKRLIEFLFDEERRRYPRVDQFWLWVFDDNEEAISFYSQMGFEFTGVSKKHVPSGRTELRYRYTWNLSSSRASEGTAANETYRILNAE